MAWQCGPILHYLGAEPGVVHLAALVVCSGAEPPPPLQPAEGAAVEAEPLWQWRGRRIWRYRFALPRPAGGGARGYRIGERAWEVSLPGERLRIAFTACNGDHENDAADYDSPERNERWRDLMGEHQRDPFHLLLQGGDQLYADDLWHEVEELRRWGQLPRRRRLAYRLSADGEAAVADFYFEHYCRLWSQRDLVEPLARIPSLMMWDDHDIFDGWGSHPARRQACPVFQAVWRQARSHFMLFQLGCSPGQPGGVADESSGAHFGWVRRIGDIAVVAPDLRSERKRRQVLGEAGWHWLTDTLERVSDCRRLLFVSTVPLANVNLALFERMLLRLPGQQTYQDDLHDQWCSHVHRREWRRLVGRLLDWSAANEIPVTVLSGEIHLAAWGRIERRDALLEQLISSGVAHPAPPQWIARIYNWLGRPPRLVRPGTKLRMLPLPVVEQRYLAQRNWLALTCHPNGTLDACWRPDGPVPELPLRCT